MGESRADLLDWLQALLQTQIPKIECVQVRARSHSRDKVAEDGTPTRARTDLLVRVQRTVK